MRLAALLLLSLVSFPLVGAAPVDRTLLVYRGVAEQGSLDEASDWEDVRACSDAITRVVAVFTLTEGSEGDELAVTAGMQHVPVILREDRPVVIQGANHNGCANFTVEGVRVATEASYTVAVQVLTGAFV